MTSAHPGNTRQYDLLRTQDTWQYHRTQGGMQGTQGTWQYHRTHGDMQGPQGT